MEEEIFVCPYCFSQRVIFLNEIELGIYKPIKQDNFVDASFVCGTYMFEKHRIRQSIECMKRQRDRLHNEKYSLIAQMDKLKEKNKI